MTDDRAVLAGSVKRLRQLAEPLQPGELRSQAYPSEWTVADVLSHLGSGAVITALRVDEALGGSAVDSQPIWDEWNAKDPDAKAADALRADQALLDRLDALSADERERFQVEVGPMRLDFGGFVRLRVNEHTVHTWDIAVAFDPTAVLAPDAVDTVLLALPMIATFVGKPTGTTRDVTVRTTTPDHRFVISLSADGVAVARTDDDVAPDLVLPAEALIRLVYGRLDKDHTPRFEGAEPDLDELRRAFPGI
jgi:uncharacterized protein (TIGR03083 family)